MWVPVGVMDGGVVRWELKCARSWVWASRVLRRCCRRDAEMRRGRFYRCRQGGAGNPSVGAGGPTGGVLRHCT